MKVLHINSCYIYTWLHQQMLEAFADDDFSNTVFSPVQIGAKGVVEVNDNVVVDQCFKKFDRALFYYKQSKILKSARNNLDVNEFDLFHAYTLFTDGNIAYELHKQTGIPYVVAIRNTDVNTFFKYRPYLKGRALKILKNASAVFFLSDSYKKRVLEKHIPKKFRDELDEKSYVIPNGIADGWLQSEAKPTEYDGGSVNIVCAGLVDRNKNYLTTLKACEILQERGIDVTFNAVGRIGDETVHKALMDNPLAQYHPPKTRDELIELYKTQTVFVMPSFEESFGLVYAEALSQGLPVVYTKGEGFDGQFTNGVVGFSVDPNNPNEIADRVEDILKDYARFSATAVEKSKVFNWHDITKKYTEIYKKII